MRHGRGRIWELARQEPSEWRCRGLTPPDELAALVQARLDDLPSEPAYGDFFRPALALDDHLYGGCGGLDEVHTGLSGGDVDEAAVLVKAFARRVRSESHVGLRRRVFADVRQERVEDLAAKSPALA